MCSNEKGLAPVCVAPWTELAHELKGSQSDSQLGHIPGLQARSLDGGT